MNSQDAALLGDKNGVELRDRSHLCCKSIINYDLDITNILVVSPQVRSIEIFDITNPRFNEQIWPVPSDFVKSRFHCIRIPYKDHDSKNLTSGFLIILQ